eukprot:g9780.t1
MASWQSQLEKLQAEASYFHNPGAGPPRYLPQTLPPLRKVGLQGTKKAVKVPEDPSSLTGDKVRRSVRCGPRPGVDEASWLRSTRSIQRAWRELLQHRRLMVAKLQLAVDVRQREVPAPSQMQRAPRAEPGPSDLPEEDRVMGRTKLSEYSHLSKRQDLWNEAIFFRQPSVDQLLEAQVRWCRGKTAEEEVVALGSGLSHKLRAPQGAPERSEAKLLRRSLSMAMAVVSQDASAGVRAAALVAPDETAYDLFQMLRNSRGTALPCFDEHLPAGILSPDYAVVLHGEPSTGKSVLLRNILATHLLPKACDGHGLPSVLVDADNAFDVWLLAKLLQDRARRSGVNSEEAVDLVTDALGRLLVFRPCEPLDLLQQLRQLRSIFSSNPTAGLLVIDSMSAWQSMTAAFPRSAGATLKECWRAVARLQQEASVAAVIAHRDAAVEFPLHFEAIHLGLCSPSPGTSSAWRPPCAVGPSACIQIEVLMQSAVVPHWLVPAVSLFQLCLASSYLHGMQLQRSEQHLDELEASLNAAPPGSYAEAASAALHARATLLRACLAHREGRFAAAEHEATPKQVPVAIHQNELKQEEVSGAKAFGRPKAAFGGHTATPKQVSAAIHQNEPEQEEVSGAKAFGRPKSAFGSHTATPKQNELGQEEVSGVKAFGRPKSAFGSHIATPKQVSAAIHQNELEQEEATPKLVQEEVSGAKVFGRPKAAFGSHTATPKQNELVQEDTTLEKGLRIPLAFGWPRAAFGSHTVPVLAVSAQNKHEATLKQGSAAIHQNELQQEKVSGAKAFGGPKQSTSNWIAHGPASSWTAEHRAAPAPSGKDWSRGDWNHDDQTDPWQQVCRQHKAEQRKWEVQQETEANRRKLQRKEAQKQREQELQEAKWRWSVARLSAAIWWLKGLPVYLPQGGAEV